MVPEQTRYSLILWETMQVLRDTARPMSRGEVAQAVESRLHPTAYELDRIKSGTVRWQNIMQWESGDATTVGWMTKRDGWSITEAGLEALETYPTPDELYAERVRRYREIDQRRKQAQETLSGVERFIVSALEVVDEGDWTAWDDLAELVGVTPQEVGHFLAGSKIKLPNAYRVLTPDGRVPDAGMLNFNYRGTDLQQRLALEGIEFDAEGQANSGQRLNAEKLKGLIETKQEAEAAGSVAVPAKRAWMVRGSNIDGYNLVPESGRLQSPFSRSCLTG